MVNSVYCETRMEQDSIGNKQIPANAYYGVQSLRAMENFSITGRRLHPEMINSLARLKKACAMANGAAGVMDMKVAIAIEQACDLILEGKFHDQFIVDPIQGGAGTSINMNANEVIANVAIEIMGGKLGDYSLVHPNDHVNYGQSTNDVIPTAGKMTALVLLHHLEETLTSLYHALRKKAVEFDSILKMGRTQMQDAVPIRLGAEFGAYSMAITRDIKRLSKALIGMYSINLGGTAVGTALNANPDYVDALAPTLSEISGLTLRKAVDLVDGTQNLDTFAFVSATLKTCAISCSKIANDLRLMSSGPRCGFEEINLPAMQNGSSIMPGKVNPVIPEVMSQTAFCIMGNDVCITMAAEAGQLELNYAEPVLYHKLFESIIALTGAVDTFTVNCVAGITANEDRCRELVEGSVGLITAICPTLGYTESADIAKRAIKTGESVREILKSKDIMTEEEIDRLLDPETMV